MGFDSWRKRQSDKDREAAKRKTLADKLNQVNSKKKPQRRVMRMPDKGLTTSIDIKANLLAAKGYSGSNLQSQLIHIASMQQAYMNAGLQQQFKQQAGLALNKPSIKAAGTNPMATTTPPGNNNLSTNAGQLFQMYYSPTYGTGTAIQQAPTDPTSDPQFKQGDKVTLGQGKAAYTVKNHQWDGYRFIYSVVSNSGVAKKAFEETIKPMPKEKSKVGFDTVILEDAKKQAIIDTMKGVENHELIFSHWGFEDVMEKGRATSFLFYGVPGTGKTLMAQAIADHLGLDLLIIGTAEIESSEPGGAERAIKQFFQVKNKVLLFDECDSLVYERGAVGAILGAQVNALLTSLENYDGTVIFTTNRLGVLDEAFNRRLSLKVEFEMPSLEHRIAIWQRMFPKKAPLDKDINWARLASVEVTGGYIKNAVLRAARIAANRKLKSISEQVIVDALKLEIESMIEFEEARDNTYHVPRQGGGYQMSQSTDITKTIGGNK